MVASGGIAPARSHDFTAIFEPILALPQNISFAAGAPTNNRICNPHDTHVAWWPTFRETLR